MFENLSLLLTGCINPNGMEVTAINDVKTRKRQYIDAINYYLTATSIPIVFVENSNYDISSYFQEAIDNGRMECISFDGNNYDKSKGKGYGEALIMMKALSSSSIIKESKYVVKITGRVVVKNIGKIISQSRRNYRFPYVVVDFYDKSFIPTMVFTFTPSHFKDFLEIHYSELDDSQDRIFEWLFYQYAKSDDLAVYPYLISPAIDGFCGGFGNRYEIRPFIKALDWNFRGMSVILHKKGHHFKGFLYYCLFVVFHTLSFKNKRIYNWFIINPKVS